MSVKLSLELKTTTDRGEFYTFIENGEYCNYDKESSIRLIHKYRASDRNCMTDGKRISLKPGYGTLKIADRTTVYKSIESKIPEKGIGTRQKLPDGVNIFIGELYEKQCTIYENDSYFRTVSQDRTFLKNNKYYLKTIDSAEITDYNLLTVKTPYGTTAVTNISTGLKTLLNIVYIKSITKNFVLVNIDECGDNMLPYIFKEVNGTNIGLCLNHAITSIPKGYTVYVNGKEIVGIDDIYAALMGGDDE